MAKQIEVYPFRGAPPLGKSKFLPVKFSSFIYVSNLYGKVKGGEVHLVSASLVVDSRSRQFTTGSNSLTIMMLEIE